jgi:hypothetical protein
VKEHAARKGEPVEPTLQLRSRWFAYWLLVAPGLLLDRACPQNFPARLFARAKEFGVVLTSLAEDGITIRLSSALDFLVHATVVHGHSLTVGAPIDFSERHSPTVFRWYTDCSMPPKKNKHIKGTDQIERTIPLPSVVGGHPRLKALWDQHHYDQVLEVVGLFFHSLVPEIGTDDLFTDFPFSKPTKRSSPAIPSWDLCAINFKKQLDSM